jgi:hypothetical protein
MGNPPVNPIPPYVASQGAYDNPSGATIRPQYVERRPPMWAVADTELDAIGLTSTMANVSFAIGSFCLGFALNIVISYEGSPNLTPVAEFLLHRCTEPIIGAALFFYVVGVGLLCKKSNLWKKIKSESKQVTPPLSQ